jgi:hypothetical protein
MRDIRAAALIACSVRGTHMKRRNVADLDLIGELLAEKDASCGRALAYFCRFSFRQRVKIIERHFSRLSDTQQREVKQRYVEIKRGYAAVN